MTPRPGTDAEDSLARGARRAANHRVAFAFHASIWLGVSCFLTMIATPVVGGIVFLAWGLGVGAHGFFAVLAPPLRRRWIAEETVRRRDLAPTADRPRPDARHARAMEALSAAIAHEIRNPVTAARSLVAQIGEDPAAPEVPEFAKVAVEELDRVERSIAHLLRYAREEGMEPRDVRLPEVVDSALESLRDRLGGVELRRHDDAPVTLRADPEQLRRVVINLVGNALEALSAAATPGPRVELVSGANLARTEGWLRVRDNGPGVPAEARERIFAPFHTTKSTGSGLGLAIARKLVEAHGGTLEALSPTGAGAEFVVTLPAAEARP